MFVYFTDPLASIQHTYKLHLCRLCRTEFSCDVQEKPSERYVLSFVRQTQWELRRGQLVTLTDLLTVVALSGFHRFRI